MKFEEKLKKKAGGRAFVYSFENVAWASRWNGLGDAGFINSDVLKLSELKAEDAEKLLTNALSTDLCYETEVMSKSIAKELAKEFIEMQDKQAHFFTNSSIPYGSGEKAWSFTPITEATIDTGVMVKVGKQLDSMLWVADID